MKKYTMLSFMVVVSLCCFNLMQTSTNQQRLRNFDLDADGKWQAMLDSGNIIEQIPNEVLSSSGEKWAYETFITNFKHWLERDPEKREAIIDIALFMQISKMKATGYDFIINKNNYQALGDVTNDKNMSCFWVQKTSKDNGDQVVDV